jgi:hypothetical protein
MLDPKDELQEASDLVLKIFAGGKIALLDVPCGAGAASVTLLSTIACLRKEKRLPSLPLDVMLVGGDLSQPARELAERLIVALQPTLEAQSIFVQSQWAEWNALDADETTGLLNDWITGSVDFDRHFLVLANFSSFLHREKQFTKANPQLREMIRWTSLRASSIVLWVEPPTNEAANFFQQLGGALLTKLRRIGLWRRTEPGRPHASTLCNMQHPLEPARTYRTGVHIIVLKQTASI